MERWVLAVILQITFLLQEITAQDACMHVSLSCQTNRSVQYHNGRERSGKDKYWDSSSVTGIHCTNVHMPLSCHTKRDMHSTHGGGFTNHKIINSMLPFPVKYCFIWFCVGTDNNHFGLHKMRSSYNCIT